MKWWLAAVRKYAFFRGRARRREFWYFALFNLIFGVIWAVIAGAIAAAGGMDNSSTRGLIDLYTLAFLLPGIAVSVRRLHDTGRSAWWLLIALVPIVGGIILLVFYCLDSQPGPNEYGPNPKTAIDVSVSA